jgi:hypothetical protein
VTRFPLDSEPDLDGFDADPQADVLANSAIAKRWVNDLEKALLARGYFGRRLRSVLDWATIDGTAEAIPAGLLTYESDRALIEWHIPFARENEWARYQGHIDLVHTAEGRA